MEDETTNRSEVMKKRTELDHHVDDLRGLVDFLEGGDPFYSHNVEDWVWRLDRVQCYLEENVVPDEDDDGEDESEEEREEEEVKDEVKVC